MHYRDAVREITPGMSKAEVISHLGEPDCFQRQGNYETLTYAHRLMSGWGWDRTDYSVVLENGKVVQYSNGPVRERNPYTGVIVTAPLGQPQPAPRLQTTCTQQGAFINCW